MRFHSVMSGQAITSATRCATITPADGMEETAPSTLMIPGKTAQQLCSAGDTLMMGNVMGSVTAKAVYMMALIAKDRKASATLCMISIAKTIMLMVTVTKAVTMQSVNGTVWTVPTICQRSLLTVTWFWLSTFLQNSSKTARQHFSGS